MAYSSIIAGAKAAGATIAPILESIVALASNGLIVCTSSTTVAARTLTGTANRISITNGDGVSGNPTFDIGSDVVTLAGTALTASSVRVELTSAETETLKELQYPYSLRAVYANPGVVTPVVRSIAIVTAPQPGA